MESFYGGKQGRSYKIVAHFNSIEDMVKAFRQGNSYTDVAYDEYVIIDTILRKNEKNNAENGILYRRGYDYSEIFNPSGVTLNENNSLSPLDTKIITLYANNYNQEYTYTDDSHLTSGTYSISAAVPIYSDFTYTIKSNAEYEVQILANSFKTDEWNDDWTSFVTHPGGGAIYIGQIVGPEGDSPAVEIIEWNNLLEYNEETTELIKGQLQVAQKPGYDAAAANTQGYDENGFHDTMQYGFCTLRDSQGNVTGSYIAFDIPYTVFNIQAEDMEPYNIPTNLITEQSDSIGHPYYKHYNIKIPKGIHGQDITELLINNVETDDSTTTGQYLAYKIKNYTDELNPTESNPINISPYKIISNISAVSYDNPYNYYSSEDEENTQANYQYPHELIINYTYGEPTVLNYNMIENIWYQSIEDENEVLQLGHIYAKMSSQDSSIAPLDLGLFKQIVSITKGQVIAKIPNDMSEDPDNPEMIIGYIDTQDDDIYINFNDITYLEVPVAEIEEIARNEDLLLMRFKNVQEDIIGQTYEYGEDAEGNPKKWVNLGSLVKQTHIFGNINTEQDLKTTYPNGLPGNKAGWIISIGNMQDGYALYCYDYFLDPSTGEPKGWYKIQDTSATSIKPEYSVILSTEPLTETDYLNENGLWFIITE